MVHMFYILISCTCSWSSQNRPMVCKGLSSESLKHM